MYKQISKYGNSATCFTNIMSYIDYQKYKQIFKYGNSCCEMAKAMVSRILSTRSELKLTVYIKIPSRRFPSLQSL